MRTVIVNGDALSVQDVIDVAGGEARAELGPGVPERMAASRQVVADALAGDAAVYGVNTGFGALADTRVGEQDLRRLQGAIVLSHAAGVGEPLDDATVRAVLLLRARTLAAGYSGVRHDLPQRLLRFLELGLLPVVPGKGSVGASGDLAQLAHLAQPLIGAGRLRGPGDGPQGRPAGEVLGEYGIEPLQLAPKEGLSLVNGTEPMQALLAFSVHDAGLLVRAADVACALSVEALLGHARPYDERVQALRPHPGQLESAANLRALLAGSALMASHRESRHAVQDAYCLRCAPQVHGAVRDVLGYARGVLKIELGSVVDNPVIADDGEVMITGNFHGEPLAFAADMLAMGHQLGLHAGPVHRGVAGQREQGARPSGQRGHHPHLREAGRSRVHGLDRRAQAARGDRERPHLPGRGDPLRGAGHRPAVRHRPAERRDGRRARGGAGPGGQDGRGPGGGRADRRR